MLLKEVVTFEARRSPCGSMTERYNMVADRFHEAPRAAFRTEHKHAKDRFQLLFKLFEIEEVKCASMPWTEESLNPIEVLLVVVVEDMKGFSERTVEKIMKRTG